MAATSRGGRNAEEIRLIRMVARRNAVPANEPSHTPEELARLESAWVRETSGPSRRGFTPI